MRKMTIWRRLNASLALLILLLLIGAGLAWWVEYAGSKAALRNNELLAGAARIRLQLVQMNDALRGLLLDPRNDLDRKSSSSAENELNAVLDEMQTNFVHRAE